MSKADEMFEELGYKLTSKTDEYIIYEKEDNNTYPYKIELCFNLKSKSVIKSCKLYNDRCWLSMQELQAINEKCKELGWLDVSITNKKEMV